MSSAKRRRELPPSVTTTTMTTLEVGVALTTEMRAAYARDDRDAQIRAARILLWLNSTTALARAAKHRQLVRCPSCHEQLPEVGELHDLLHRLAVEL